jgi:hypothetical protein
MVLGFRSAVSRRIFTAFCFAALLGFAVSLQAHQGGAAAPQAPAATPPQAAPVNDPFKFSQETVLIVFGVKPDKTADFESGWAAIKERLSKSEKAELKEVGASINVLKVDAPAGQGPALYILHLNPPSKSQSYDPTQLIYYTGAWPERKEADDLFNKIKDSIASINPWPLKKVG